MDSAKRTKAAIAIGCLLMMGVNAMGMGVKSDIKTSTALLECVVNVKAFGAKGDGINDDTAAVQKALDYAKIHTPVCYLPAGHYRLNGSLTIPAGVTLMGASGSVNHSKTPNGTTMLIYGGKGDVNGQPAIILDWSATIRQVTIHYPEQLPPPQVTPYPWTIQARGQLCQVLDVVLTNPYRAIDVGTYRNELHLIRNVFACPLNIGIYIDRCTDVGRVENVHFNPNFWKRSKLEPVFPTGGATDEDGIEQFQNDLLGNYLLANFIGFKIGKTDWEYMSNCFVILAKEGFVFDDYGYGTGNALITQSGSDVGPVAVAVRQTQKHSGVQFTNCQFMAKVVIDAQNQGPVKISNSGFWPIGDTPEQVVKYGPSTLILNACHFADWDKNNAGKPCIYAAGGRVSIAGCEFMAEKTAILFDKGLVAGMVYGSLFRGTGRLINQSGIEIESGFNTEQ